LIVTSLSGILPFVPKLHKTFNKNIVYQGLFAGKSDFARCRKW